MKFKKVIKEVKKKELDRMLKKMNELDPSSKEYGELFDLCMRLSDDLDKSWLKEGVKIDTLVNCACSLAGILLVINAEQVGIVTSKAFSLLKRPKT